MDNSDTIYTHMPGDVANQNQIQLDETSLWRAVIAKLELTFSELTVRSFLRNTVVQNITESSLEIICPSTHAKNMLIKNCDSAIKSGLEEVAEKKYNVIYKVGKLKPPIKTKSETTTAPLFESPTYSTETQKSSGLSPKYTFENYVTGNNNQLAHSMAWAIAETPGSQYNPFFLHSGVGLGKTHLVQAIGNKILQTKPKLKVLYTTGEAFTNELIDAIQNSKNQGKNNPNKFRNKFRNVDILLIDDIQFIIGKEATQQEFFHTFNTLYQSQKQIILTSDKHPSEFKTLEKRLTSRFKSGVIVEIQPPDFETRNAILRKRRDETKDPVTNEVITFIAQKITTNIRELEGAYLQILSYAQAKKLTIDKEFALQILGQSLVEDKQQPLNLNAIVNAVCKYYAIPKKDLKGKCRTQNLVIPRQVAMYLLRELTETPYMTIGELLGGRDHTTILHGIRKVQKGVIDDIKLEQDIKNVRNIIYES